MIDPINKNDECCVMWSIITVLYHEEIENHPECISNLRQYADRLNRDGLEFLVSPKDIPTFERNSNLQVSVFDLKGEEIYIIKNDGYMVRRQVNLLLITNGESSNYVGIVSLSRLLASHNNKNGNKKYESLNCLQLFNSAELRYEHFNYCVDNKAVKTEMPEPGSVVKFQDEQKQMRVPFIIYVETETVQPTLDSSVQSNVRVLSTASSKDISKHVSLGFCVSSICSFDSSYNLTKTYRGEDSMERLAKHLEQEAIMLFNIPQKTMIGLTPKEWERHSSATKCHVCGKEYGDLKNPKVRDHDHYTGKYR